MSAFGGKAETVEETPKIRCFITETASQKAVGKRMGSSAATENEYDWNAEECGASAPFGAEEVFGVRASRLEPPTRVPNTPLAFDGEDGRERMKRREFIMLQEAVRLCRRTPRC